MPGKAKSNFEKARKLRHEHNELMAKAVALFRLNDTLPTSERKSLRAVCTTITAAHQRETGRWVNLDKTTPPTPVRAIGRVLSKLRQTNEKDGFVDEDLIQAAREARDALTTSALSFLTDKSPIQSTSQLPSFAHPPVPAPPSMSHLPSRSQTSMTAPVDLEGEIKTVEDELEQYRTIINQQRAMILIQSEYCESVRHQLEAAENKADQPSRTGRLVGDGLPRVLTGTEFIEKVRARDAAQAEQVSAKECNRVEREARASAMSEWKGKMQERKETNKKITLRWREEVEHWEAERDLAKTEHRRPQWTKPKRGALILAIPKPQASPAEAEEGMNDEDDEHEGDELSSGEE
ncbi:hypothetical protein BN946_scf184925.g5 [Trametes cinnabarina]|uniref:Uncharacterized protein n=1 Tax=Pycnoporus cinnabarinus TaxID=5643 RepID=A0A060SVC6_PYCCI|nr:hypothetical protein BN946_scf184925.g5 [Trametes cinnabarina]